MASSSKSIEELRDPARRISFRVISCTSQQQNFLANQLELQSPQSKGWSSERFCSYPQHITIQLLDLAIVEKLTFLSHQSKITTKIDIECKQELQQSWRKLGYTCMQSNMTTNYEARELRTVKLNKELVKYFKFTLHSNYINTINVFNQVALIAISIYGERYHPKPLEDMKQKGILPPGALLDKQTLDKLRQLEYMKRQAIQINDFQKASELKQQIDKLKSGVQALAVLQKQKKDAIRREDYEEAKRIYEKMKKIRGPLPRTVVTSIDRYDGYNKSQQNPRETQTYTPMVQMKKKQNRSMTFDIENTPIKPQKGSPISQLKKSDNLPQVAKPKKVLNVDQIKVGPKHDNSYNFYQDQAYLEEQQRLFYEQKQSPRSPNEKGQGPQGNQSKFLRNKIKMQNSVHEEDQEPQHYKRSLPPQCQQYFAVIPELTLKNLISDDKNLREHALDQILALVDTIEHEDYLEKLFINAVIFSVKQVIDDKIVNVILKATSLLGVTFKQYKPKPEQVSRQNSKNLKYILQKLSQYLGHSNEKIKSETEDVYIVLPKYSKLTSKQTCIQTITLTEKMDRSPRQIISKLEMLGRLIRKYDQQVLKNNSSILNQKKEKYEDVIEYSKRFLEDRNSEVRQTALKLLAFVGKIIGQDSLLKNLDDVKESTRDMILQRMAEKNQTSEKTSSIALEGQKSVKSPRNNSPRGMPQKKSPVLKRQQSPKLIKRKQQIKAPVQPSPTQIKEPKATMPEQRQIRPQKKEQLQYNPKNPEYICEYCELYDKRLQKENFRDIHWFKSCPLITICKQCQQCIEVEFINQHLLQECEKRKFYKKCPRCKQAIFNKNYNEHVQSKRCIVAKPLNVANRCPHCHQDIEPKKKGWIKHLKQEGCPCQKDRAN